MRGGQVEDHPPQPGQLLHLALRLLDTGQELLVHVSWREGRGGEGGRPGVKEGDGKGQERKKNVSNCKRYFQFLNTCISPPHIPMGDAP